MTAAKRGAGRQRPVTPLVAADCVVFDAKGRVLLVRRRNPPFQGQLAIPGGFVDIGETVAAAARRELQEETGVAVKKLAFVGVYSDPARDPRGHTIAIAYAARIRSARAKAGDDAATAEWVADWRSQSLAFDHAEILADAERVLGIDPPIAAKSRAG